MKINHFRLLLFCSMTLALLLVCNPAILVGQTAQQPPSKSSAGQQQPSQAVPVIDGGAGPCSIVLTVTFNGKPVYAANVKVHIQYGFAGIRKLDLEAGTNMDGKVKFAGLPQKVHRPPLVFHAGKDQLTGFANYDPATECQAIHDISMNPPAAK